jgi:hypothetical protein
VLHLGLLLQKAIGLRCQPVAQFFDLKGLEAIEPIRGSAGVKA